MSEPASPSAAITERVGPPSASPPQPTLLARRSSSQWPAVAAVVVTVAAWASAFVVIRAVSAGFSPGALALGRLVVGAVALGGLLLVRRAWVRPTGREWGLLLVCALTWFAVYNLALNAAERRVDAGTAAMLVNVGPVLIALLAGSVLGEGYPRWLLAGAGGAFTGAVLIGLATTGTARSDGTGVVLCLAAAISYAIGVVAQKVVLRRLPALQVTWLACLIAALACSVFAPALARQLVRAPIPDVIGLVYLGLVPTAAAFSTWAYALARMDAGRLSVSTYVVPPLTVVGAWLLLGQAPPLPALAGGGLALLGVALSRHR